MYIDDWGDGDFDEGGGGKYLRVEDCGEPGSDGKRPGQWIHFFVEAVTEPTDQREKKEGDRGEYYHADPLILELRALKPDGVADKLKSWKLKRTGVMSKRIARLAAMFGLVTKEMITAAKEAGRSSIEVPWEGAVSMTFFGKLEVDSFNGVEKDSEGKPVLDGAGKQIPKVIEYADIRWEFCSVEDGVAQGLEPDPMHASGDPFSNPVNPEPAAAGADDFS